MSQVKRRLTSIRLDKIAGVDLPCQEHATVAIVKRAPEKLAKGSKEAIAWLKKAIALHKKHMAGTAPTTGDAGEKSQKLMMEQMENALAELEGGSEPGMAMKAIMKRSFDEALRAQLVGERISEVFWRAFDKQYAVREAFREALGDELAEGGDGTTATDAFTGAMRTIAETAVKLAQEAGAGADETNLESAVEQAVAKWLKQQETSEMKITTKAALSAAVASFAIAKSSFADGQAIIDAAVELDAIDLLPEGSELAKAADEKKKKFPHAKDDKAVKALEREVAVLKMAEPIRKHFDALDTAAQDAFIAKSDADRQAEIDAANSADPVVYKSAGGIEIRKSDGAVAAMLAKQVDEQAATIAVLKSDRSADTLEKRAATEFPNVAKGTAVAMLKTAGQLGETTEAGKDVLKSLAAMNKSTGGVFKSLGSTEAPAVAGSISKAREDFNGAVSKIMARDKIGMADAMSKARTEEAALFAEAYPETAALDNEDA